MPRILILAAFCVASVNAAIWPEHLGKYDRKSVKPAAGEIASGENGKDAVEEASYGSFSVSAERFKDSTGAYAGSLEMPVRPLQVGNYLITCTGRCPKDLDSLVGALPMLSRSALPALRNYLPVKNLVPRSERYILGPRGWRAAVPQVPESAVN